MGLASLVYAAATLSVFGRKKRSIDDVPSSTETDYMTVVEFIRKSLAHPPQ